MIAVESDPEELHSLLRQLEFALTEYGLDVQNRAVFLSNPPKTSHSPTIFRAGVLS